MRYLIAAIVAATAALVIVAGSSAALAPGVYDPGATGCPQATWDTASETLILVKPCPTETNAAAGADITGFEGDYLTGLSFTYDWSNAVQANGGICGAGSPRFDVVFQDGSYRIFTCQYGHHTVNEDGTVTVTFDSSTPYCDFETAEPDGWCFDGDDSSKIAAIDILLDESGRAHLSDITVNGIVQVPEPEVTPPVVEPGIEQTFLCQKYQRPWPATGPGTSLPSPKLLGEAPGLVASGEWYVPFAIAGTHDQHDDNIGGYRLVCNVDGMKPTGNVLDGSGQQYGPAYLLQFVNYWKTSANIYAIYK